MLQRVAIRIVQALEAFGILVRTRDLQLLRIGTLDVALVGVIGEAECVERPHQAFASTASRASCN